MILYFVSVSEAGFRVRFPVEQTHEHDSEIVVRNESDNQISVHLGFLKMSHHYTIKFSIKDNLTEDLDADPLQNLHCKVLHVMPSEDGEYQNTILYWVKSLCSNEKCILSQ